jgi:SAM-dependent methyltransferase
MFMDHPKLERAFRLGEGVDWGEHHPALFEGTDRFFRNAYAAHLVSSWIPALDGAEQKLREGATVADVGCGHGTSTIIMARAYPHSRFWGFDSHAPSIEAARKAAAREHVTDNTAFAVASATDFPKPTTGIGGRGLGGYDLVAFFDSLHSMADPVGAGKHVRSALRQDGTWMVVEPLAHDKVAANLTPVGRMYSAVSALVSVPASLAQRGPALGAQAGETKLRETIQRGGFARVRKAAQTAFNLVIEARP